MNDWENKGCSAEPGTIIRYFDAPRVSSYRLVKKRGELILQFCDDFIMIDGQWKPQWTDIPTVELEG